MKYGNRYSLKRLLSEKFELDKPLDTSTEDWKGYFEKADDLDKSVRDDFIAAREMADEALEMLDGERDNILAAMEEVEAAKAAKEKEIEEQKKKEEAEQKKTEDILARLNKRGDIDPEEWAAGKEDTNELHAQQLEAREKLISYVQEVFQWGMKNQRMDATQQAVGFMEQLRKVTPLAKKFAYPEGVSSGVKQRGYYPMVQQCRAQLGLYTWLLRKIKDSFFWQGDFPPVDQVVDKLPPPKRLSKLLDEK